MRNFLLCVRYSYTTSRLMLEILSTRTSCWDWRNEIRLIFERHRLQAVNSLTKRFRSFHTGGFTVTDRTLKLSCEILDPMTMRELSSLRDYWCIIHKLFCFIVSTKRNLNKWKLHYKMYNDSQVFLNLVTTWTWEN